MFLPLARATGSVSFHLRQFGVMDEVDFFLAALVRIRYPSVAAHSKGSNGRGIVIFRNCVRPPAFVRIIGPTDVPLGQWP
jgi:hypothetical protein